MALHCVAKCLPFSFAESPFFKTFFDASREKIKRKIIEMSKTIF